MNTSLIRKLSLLSFGSLAIAMSAPAAQATSVLAPVPYRDASECDATCLEGFVDSYLDAMLAHDPSLLPLSRGVRFTENTVPLNLGEGLWTTAGSLGPYRIVSSDPRTGQASYIGVVVENGKPVMLALRLLIKDGMIREVETAVARVGLLTPRIPERLATATAQPSWADVLDPSERVSREEMIWAANQYFEGMEQDTGTIVPFAPGCNRTENGDRTTNNPGLLASLMPPGAMPPSGDAPPPGAAMPPPGAVPAAGNPMMMDCQQQMNSGGMWIFTTPERRYWLVDEARGIVIGMFMFTVTGLPKDGTIGAEPPAGMMGMSLYPSSKPIVEAFKIRNGRIEEIEAIMAPEAGYRMSDGW